MKVTIKRPIIVTLDQEHIKEDDGDLYYTVEPGEYDLSESDEYALAEGQISINVTLPAYFWAEDVEEGTYKIQREG